MHYELAYIVSAQVPENEHGAIQEEVLANLKKAKATIKVEPNSLGRKRLAYPIENQKHGFYYVLEFDFEELGRESLKDLDTALRHNKNILRHLIIKISGKVRAASNNRQEDRKDAKAERVLRKTKDSDKKEDLKDEKEEVVKENVNLDHLDQQLDQILEKDQ
ncbi:30S ribosomal protein S6 [Candidatus Nomurabacteria bacterium]|nr:30S ribosomal protein S6 [Candidatus Nomurabacteria bacterium]